MDTSDRELALKEAVRPIMGGLTPAGVPKYIINPALPSDKGDTFSKLYALGGLVTLLLPESEVTQLATGFPHPLDAREFLGKQLLRQMKDHAGTGRTFGVDPAPGHPAVSLFCTLLNEGPCADGLEKATYRVQYLQRTANFWTAMLVTHPALDVTITHKPGDAKYPSQIAGWAYANGFRQLFEAITNSPEVAAA